MDERPPGFHRGIVVSPSPGMVSAGLEDNLHRFELELCHEGGVVTDVVARTIRYPWTTCADAPAFLREQLTGRRLDALSGLNIYSHCTHLFEMALLCAGHAGDNAPIRFDLHVAEWEGDTTRVELRIDGRSKLSLDLSGREVTTPGPWQGRDLLRPDSWRDDLAPEERETAMLVTRAIYVSLGRISPVVQRATERGPDVLGVCFSYQPSRVGDAFQMPESRREFGKAAAGPLEDFPN